MTVKSKVEQGGLEVQSSAGVSTFSVSDAGAVTAGPASGTDTVAHTTLGYSSSYTATISNRRTDASAAGLLVQAGRSASADALLHLKAQDGSDNSVIYSNGVAFFRTANWGTGGTAVGIDSGTLTTSPSSRRYKENETALTVESSKIYQIQIKEFDYIESKGGAHDFGPIAEDVEAILPELVWKEAGQPESIRETKMVWLLLEEMKKHQALIEALQAKVAALEALCSASTQP